MHLTFIETNFIESVLCDLWSSLIWTKVSNLFQWFTADTQAWGAEGWLPHPADEEPHSSTGCQSWSRVCYVSCLLKVFFKHVSYMLQVLLREGVKKIQTFSQQGGWVTEDQTHIPNCIFGHLNFSLICVPTSIRWGGRLWTSWSHPAAFHEYYVSWR